MKHLTYMVNSIKLRIELSPHVNGVTPLVYLDYKKF